VYLDHLLLQTTAMQRNQVQALTLLQYRLLLKLIVERGGRASHADAPLSSSKWQ
jgi:hypothetical protein